MLAASTTGGLLFAPVRGRLVDRLAPSSAVLRLVILSAATDVAFLLAGSTRAAAAVLVALALLAGAVTAPAGAALRSA